MGLSISPIASDTRTRKASATATKSARSVESRDLISGIAISLIGALIYDIVLRKRSIVNINPTVMVNTDAAAL